jgi:hypothetical protein
MVIYIVVLKKELDGVKGLKQLTLLYDLLPNPWFPFIINYCTVTYDQLNVTYAIVVRIALKVYKLQLQCHELFIYVI